MKSDDPGESLGPLLPAFANALIVGNNAVRRVSFAVALPPFKHQDPCFRNRFGKLVQGELAGDLVSLSGAEPRLAAFTQNGYPTSMSDLASSYPISLTLPVQWGDMDSFAHVNNVVYLRWFESARIAYFRTAGVLARMDSERIGPILARSTIDYRIALEFPDEVVASATALKLGTTSFTMGLRLTSKAHGGAVAAEGENVIVMRDYRSQQKVALWDGLRASIAALEAGGRG